MSDDETLRYLKIGFEVKSQCLIAIGFASTMSEALNLEVESGEHVDFTLILDVNYDSETAFNEFFHWMHKKVGLSPHESVELINSFMIGFSEHMSKLPSD